MNSKQLQKKFFKTYQHFFNHHDLIISIPRTILFSGKSYKYTGKADSIWVKIPQRIYLWAKFSNKRNKTIHYIYHKHSKNKFKNGELQSFYNIDRILLEELEIDFEINILAEHCFFDPEYIIILLFLAKSLNNGTITKNELKDIQINSEQIKKLQKKINLFLQKYKKSLYFVNNNKFFQLNKTTISMINSEKIILYKQNRWSKEIKIKKDRNKYFNYSQINQHLPFRINNKKNTIEKNEKLLENILNKIEKYFSYKITKNIENIDININTALFENITKYNNIINTLIKTNNINLIKKQDIKETIKKNLDFTSQDSDICIQMNQNINIFSKKYLSINTNIINEINNNKNTKFSLDYTSDKDGIGKEWLKIEQRKQKNNYSNFCSEYEIKTIKNQQFIHKTIEYHKAIQKTDWILFDSIQNKIFILWEKMWSKEIHTQSGTIELFKTILQDRGKEINNKTLPISCYSKNKNEMIGKIILPLRKVVEKKIGKKLKLDCHGSLGNFFIKLDYSNIPMYYIQKRL